MNAEDDRPVFVISVAAELSGMHPQTLRQYDRLGLVSPGRTGGGGRRYSARDVALLREVQRLSQEEGVNLAGVKRVIDLAQEADELRLQVEALQARVAELSAELDSARAALESAHVAGYQQATQALRRDLVPVRDAALVVWRPAPRR